MTTYTNTTKNSTSYSNSTKTSSSYNNSIKPLSGAVAADAGLFMGLGCLNYSGSEILVAGHTTVWSNTTK